jgi:hypothetical protein
MLRAGWWARGSNRTVGPRQPNFLNFYSSNIAWDGWGSNPRPADYENYGPALPTLYLHGYHGAVPPMALIALYARMARSTNRSTTTTASA